MGLFDKPEVTILKESSDAKMYLSQLEALQKEVKPGTDLANKIDKEIVITKAGIAGEDAIMFELKNSGMDLVVLHDLYIETKDGRGAQIDYLVITPYVNVLIECKNLFGNIEINSKGEFIRSFSYKGRWIKEGIYSPITQNERHLTVFKDRRGERKGAFMRFAMEHGFEKYNKTIVVLANPKTLINDKYAPKEVRQKVIRGDQLISVLKEFKSDVKSSKKEMLSYGENYLSMNRNDRKEYIKRFEELAALQKMDRSERDEDPAETIITTEETPAVALSKGEEHTIEQPDVRICPWCGKELVLRTAKKGNNIGKQFYGCSGFPKCRYVKNL